MHQQMQLIIEGIECSAIIGCYSYERNQHQPVLVDLEIDLDKSETNDDILNTVNYSEISDYIKEIVSLSDYKLLESLASKIANQILNRYELIDKVKVSLNKPDINGKKAKYIYCVYTKFRTHKVALAIGSNMNNPKQQLITAIELLHQFLGGIKIAPFYQSTPQGFCDQDNFINSCLSGHTSLKPLQLLVEIKKIEKLMGKMEKFTNGPRVIDIDIIFYDDIVYDGLFLNIPHPRMLERDFVLKPLADIEPDWLHPKAKRTIKELYQAINTNKQFILEKVE